ncbi:MAG TPA: hypothetical protein VLV85_07120 [Stellaceae bacterium]|jgi:hypothetical protein|nr:hypothetical protein [Stellaceae bacterium]
MRLSGARELMSLAVLAAVAATGLCGCAGRIWLDHASDQGATLHWYTREATIEEARARAAAHCSGFGKQALLLDEFEDQDVTTAHFACEG